MLKTFAFLLPLLLQFFSANSAVVHCSRGYVSETSIDPFHGDKPYEFVLGGGSPRSSGATDSIRLEQTSKPKDIYISRESVGSLRATDTGRVTIVRQKEACHPDAETIAMLEPGQGRVIKNFNGEEGATVTVRFVKVKNGNPIIEVASAGAGSSPTNVKYEDPTIEVASARAGSSPTCKDSAQSAKFAWKVGGNKRRCRFWNDHRKCNKRIRTGGSEWIGKYIHEVCQRACGQCRDR